MCWLVSREALSHNLPNRWLPFGFSEIAGIRGIPGGVFDSNDATFADSGRRKLTYLPSQHRSRVGNKPVICCTVITIGNQQLFLCLSPVEGITDTSYVVAKLHLFLNGNLLVYVRELLCKFQYYKVTFLSSSSQYIFIFLSLV